MPAKRTQIETGYGHLGVGCRDFEFHSDNQLLSATRLCRRARRRSCKRIFHNAPPMAPGYLRRLDRVRILAAAPRYAMQCQRAEGRTDSVVVRGGCRCCDDFVPSADRRIPRGPCWWAGKMKRKTIIVGSAAILLLLAAGYFWGPSSVPQGQAQLLTLTPENFHEFQAVFDTDTSAARLVLLLSPT